MTLSNSGLPYPIRCSRQRVRHRSSCRACRSDRFPASPTTKSAFALKKGDVFVFCTDGIFEAFERRGCRIRRDPSADVVSRERQGSARAIVDAIFEAVTEFRGSETAERRHDGGCREDHRLTRRAEKLGRARIVNVESGARRSGDASACLKFTHSGDPARPAGHMFKMRAPPGPSECRMISDSLSGRRHRRSSLHQ